MLIVEGSDQTGKTAFAKRCLQTLNKGGDPHIYAHFSVLPEMWEYPRDYIPFIVPCVVMDRFHMSAVAYDYACERGTRLPPEAYRWVDAYCRLVGAFTVVLTARTGVITDRWKARDEMFSAAVAEKANDVFRKIIGNKFENYKCDWDVRWHASNVDDFPNDDFMSKVMDGYRQRQSLCRCWE